jgi:hypothetical protein
MNRIDLSGGVAIVAGAARRIGRAIAERFGACGAKARDLECRQRCSRDGSSRSICSFSTSGVFDISGGRATY